MKRCFIVSAALVLLAIGLPAQDSLGDTARRLKKDKEQTATGQTAKPAAVYTNDNLPSGGTISVVGTPSAPATSAPATREARSAAGSRGPAGVADRVKQAQSQTQDWMKQQQEERENQKRCKAEGRVWVPKTPTGEGGFCGNLEQRYNAAAQKCRAAGGNWVERRSEGWVEGFCSPPNQAEQKKR